MTSFNELLQQRQAEAGADVLCSLVDTFVRAAREDLHAGNYEGMRNSVDQLTAAMKKEIPREVRKRRSESARADIDELRSRTEGLNMDRASVEKTMNTIAGKEILASHETGLAKLESSERFGSASEATIHKMAQDLSEEAGVDYETALARIVREHPDLAGHDGKIRKRQLGL